MNAVGEQCAGKPPALFDEGLLGNASDLLYRVFMWRERSSGYGLSDQQRIMFSS